MAAGSTYTPIATYTASGSVASYTFSSIPGTYTDLIVVIMANNPSSASNFELTFNGDTATNYSRTQLAGNGSSAGSSRESSYSSYRFLSTQTNSAIFSQSIFQIMNYSNSTTYKTLLDRGGEGASASAYAQVGLWRSTSAITSLRLLTGNNLGAGSTFTLYGIAAA